MKISIKFKVLILLLLLVIKGCKKSEVPQSEPSRINSVDSIIHYYKLGMEKTKAIEERLKFIDKSYHYAVNANNDSLLLKTVSYKTKLHSTVKQLDSAIIYTKKMLVASEKLMDSATIGKAYNKLGLYFNKMNVSDSSYYFYNESKTIFLLINDSIQVGRKLLNMAIILSDIGDYTQSDVTAIEALSYLEKSDLTVHKASIYNCLAISAKKQEDYDEALYWYEMAINTTENAKNKIIYLNNISNVFTLKGNYQKSISILSYIINDSLIKEDLIEKARILNNLTYAKWLLTGDESLDKQFKEALKIRIKKNNLIGQISSYDNLSEFYKNIDEEKSKQYASKMYDISTDLNITDARLESLTNLMGLYHNDLKKFQKYSGLYIQLKDSISKVRRVAKNQFAKIRYDSEKNRAENSDLKIKSVQRQLELEKMKRQKIMSISFGFLFVVAIVLIYFQIKAKHKQDNLKQVYKTEARISKKVHDEVANDMYHVMTKLQNDSNDIDAILDDLENIYIKTRDISKENSSIDLNLDFGNVLNDLLLDYKNENVQIITRNLSKINWKNVSDRRKIGIYRVLQELMTNMKKHSGASMVILSFSKLKKNIDIEYKDDGIGCKIKKNTGLQNAESRINTLNGSIKFESEINQGFRSKIIV